MEGLESFLARVPGGGQGPARGFRLAASEDFKGDLQADAGRGVNNEANYSRGNSRGSRKLLLPPLAPCTITATLEKGRR